MRYFRGEDEVRQIERRTNTRVLAYCCAELRTPAGRRSAQLTNISTGGARLQLNAPPAAGGTVILECRSFTSLCKVVWSNDVACGLAFEEPASQAVVAGISGQTVPPPPPPPPEADLRSIAPSIRQPRSSADLGNIPAGRPRGFRSTA